MNTATNLYPVAVKRLGVCHYQDIYPRMLSHINLGLPCEIWQLEHHPVYTKGRLSLDSHIRIPNEIPIIPTDRGGQVTYHGPGQMIVYPIIRLNKWGVSPKGLVDILENTTLELLANHGIIAYADPKARGVYIHGRKIASIGLKIKQGYAYHGIAINIDMDLHPFKAIVPCGNPDLIMTQLSEHGKTLHFKERWLQLFVEKLSASRYNKVS